MSKRVLLCLLLPLVASCDLIGSDPLNSLTNTDTPFERSLREYNEQATETFDAARTMFEATEAFAASGEGDAEVSDEAIEGFTQSIEAFDAEVTELDAIHTEIHDASNGQAIAPFLLGGAIVVFTMREYANWLDGKRVKAEDLKEKREEARVEGDSVAFDDYDSQLDTLKEEVIQDLGERVTTDLLTSGIDTSTVRGILLKQKRGAQIQQTIKVMSATHDCEDGWSNVACRIGFDETDNGEALVAGPGDATALLIDEDNNRQAIQVTVEPAPGDPIEVEFDPQPIDGTTPDDIATLDSENAGESGNNTSNNTNNMSTGGDRDGDGTPDDTDNCPDDPNWFQIDTDGDGIGNECDEDACPAFDLDADGCVEGMEWSRNVAACVQPTCPTGARHNADMFCCCNCWDDKTTVNVNDPCRPGYLLFCGEPPPEDGG